MISATVEHCKTFPEILAVQAECVGDRMACLHLENGTREGDSLSYAKLQRAALAVAATLRDFHHIPVLLVLPSGTDFIAAFFGCLTAGAIAVPVPYLDAKDVRYERLIAVLRDASAGAIITDLAGRAKLLGIPEIAAEPAVIFTIEELRQGAPMERFAVRPQPEDLAFLQYTSGSTGTPKGVMVSHGNLVDNVRRLKDLVGVDARDAEGQLTFVSWLPMFHDMGLIGKVLQPCYHGGRAIVMEPASFVQSPVRWLDAISRYRGYYSMSPNFGYDLCVRRLKREQTEHLDLSCWRLAINGAEPISLKTITAFAERFAENGFSVEAMNPGYGLAESTLVVTSRAPRTSFIARRFDAEVLALGRALPCETASHQARVLVSSGSVEERNGLLIVDPESCEVVPDGTVGEIWVRSASVALGYWRHPEETLRVFQARLRGDGESGDAYLRTGDLAFVFERNLYVVGRQKDLIIVNGQNFYPQDIEAAARNGCEEVARAAAIAFSVERDGRERLVVVVGVEPAVLADEATSQRTRRMVQEHLFQHERVSVYDLVLVHPRRILRTSSGKVRRREMREEYLRGGFRDKQADAVLGPVDAG